MYFQYSNNANPNIYRNLTLQVYSLGDFPRTSYASGISHLRKPKSQIWYNGGILFLTYRRTFHREITQVISLLVGIWSTPRDRRDSFLSCDRDIAILKRKKSKKFDRIYTIKEYVEFIEEIWSKRMTLVILRNSGHIITRKTCFNSIYSKTILRDKKVTFKIEQVQAFYTFLSHMHPG